MNPVIAQIRADNAVSKVLQEEARKAIPTTLESLSNVFLQDANRLQEELDSLTPGDRDFYIVTVAGLPIRYTDGKPDVSTFRSATVFVNHNDAVKWARVTFNDAKERGIAWTLQQAYVNQIEHLRKLSADLIVEAHYQGV